MFYVPNGNPVRLALQCVAASALRTVARTPASRAPLLAWGLVALITEASLVSSNCRGRLCLCTVTRRSLRLHVGGTCAPGSPAWDHLGSLNIGWPSPLARGGSR